MVSSNRFISLTFPLKCLIVYPDGRLCISILHPPGEDPVSGEKAEVTKSDQIKSYYERLFIVVLNLCLNHFRNVGIPHR
jgi:hypothetical protein